MLLFWTDWARSSLEKVPGKDLPYGPPDGALFLDLWMPEPGAGTQGPGIYSRKVSR
jgi:hypothetical protein